MASAPAAKYSFTDDYSEGGHPRVVDALTSTNKSQQKAYGADEYSELAKQYIRNHLGNPETEIHFVPSGTSANLICIASCLRPFEAVIATTSAHIATQEAGAIAALGHHIISVEPVNGKLTTGGIEQAVRKNNIPPHTVLPRLVYISNSSEAGTVYSKQELAEISALCKRSGLLLFMDGARLGTALCRQGSDVALRDIFDLTDIFWIGGTKNGALFGEAVVVKDRALAKNFAYHVKQRGALLAKGRVLGVQFAELFRDTLWFDLAAHANRMAQVLSESLERLRYRVTSEVETNQIFVVMPNPVIRQLEERFNFHVWEEVEDDCALIRLVTSWATEVAHIEAFGEYLETLTNL